MPSPEPRRGASVRRLLLGVNVTVLLVPVLAILLLGIYEDHLVDMTERKLIAESVLIGEAWRAEWMALTGQTEPDVRPPGADDRFFPIDPLSTLEGSFVDPEPEPRFRRPDPADKKRLAGIALKPVLDRAKVVNLTGVRVVDLDGCVIASTADNLDMCLGALPELGPAFAGRYHSVLRERISDEPAPALTSISRRGRIRVFTATPVFHDGEVVAVVRMSRTSLSPLRALWEYRRSLLWGAAACALLTMLISLLFARQIVRPLRRLKARAEAIARGEKPSALEGTVPAEVFALNEALASMTRQLHERAEYVAEFAANVSHELKTPLTGIRGAAELLREDWSAMADAQRQRFLENIDVDANRMQQLVTRLLYLARVENAAEADEAVEVGPFLGTLRARFPQVEFAVENPPERITISPEHLEGAVRNLIENALTHGAEPVQVRVGGREARLTVTVRDHGSGISEGNKARVLDRFFTTNRDNGGTGLGLAIVAAVARNRGGSLDFESGPQGTVFTLEL